MFIWFKRYGIFYKPASAVGWTVLAMMVGYILFTTVSLFLKESVNHASVDLLLRVVAVLLGYWFLARVTSSDAEKTSRSTNGRIHDRGGKMRF